MAEATVQFLLGKLATLLEERAKLSHNVRNDVQFAQDELRRMTAFLRVADAAEDTNPQVKEYVMQVRGVSFDIEDIIDDFMLHLPVNHESCPAFVNNLLFCIKNCNSHYETATGIRTIRTRITSIEEGYRRYQNIFDSTHVPNQLESTVNDRRGDALLIEEGELVGIDNPRKEVVTLLLEGGLGMKVVAVTGMGGLGKTTLVKKVFDNGLVKKHFQNHAWITVSHTYNVEEILKDTIQQLYEQVKIPLPHDIGSMDRDKLKATIKSFLKEKRYLLVFDDVWSANAWEAIKYVFPNENLGSRVIFTTRSMEVAKSCTNETMGYVYELKPLSDEESRILFCQKAFQGKSWPTHLTDICKNILRRCAGLPLAIVAISRVLSIRGENNINEWRMLNDGLGEEPEGNDDQLKTLKNILLLSYNYLPPYLKPCYMYLSSYPEDHLIEHNILVRQWIAEGFVEQNDGKRTAEDVAQGYLNELINRSLLRPVRTNDDGSVKISQIHDLYREIILSKSKDQAFMTTTTEREMGRRVRRLSVHGALEDDRVEGYGTQLCTLMLSHVEGPGSDLSILKLIKCSPRLKVLDLKGLKLENFPEVILELFHLKYLCLRNTGIKNLPNSIMKLTKLEMLDLKGTYINELPDGILKLLKLRQLLVYHHNLDSYMPYNYLLGFKALKGIGCLTSLQKLCVIEAFPGSDVIEEIAKLTELRRIHITKLRIEDSEALCSAITKLTKLHSLGVRSAEGESLDLQYLTSPPPYLQRLYVGGLLASFPHWIPSVHSLVKVYLRWSKLRDDPLQYLQDLPNLVHIEFLDCYIGEELRFKAKKFLKLKLLGLDKLEALRSIIIEKGAMPLLEKLIIQRCVRLERVPEGIKWLDNMKGLEFFDMPDEFISSLAEKSGDEYRKVKHIPTVYHTYWRSGGWKVYSLDGALSHEEPREPGAATQDQRNWL